MTIDKVHDDILFIADKVQGSYFSHEEIDRVLDMAQRSWFMELYGNPKQYQPGRYTPSISYGVSQKINDSLAPFKKTASFTSDVTGVVTLPTDYLHLLSMHTLEMLSSTVYKRPVRIINEDELVNRLNSQVCPVLSSDPIGILNATKLVQLFPDTLSQAGKIYYLRVPAVPEFGYIQSGVSITYDPTASTQLEWDDLNINQIINKALVLLGINLKDAEVIQLSMAQDNKGV